MHDRFIDAMVKKLHAAHAPGIATDMSTTMGALINKAQYDRTMEYIQAGRAQGATLVTGGSHPSGARLANGFFIEPTVFSDVHKDMRIASEEIFGPVLSVMRWKNEEELFEAVNGVDFGLTASIWTSNLTTAHKAAQRVQAGYVWVNECSAHFPGAPFGGYKRSGVGREESKEELFEFTQIKNVNVALPR